MPDAEFSLKIHLKGFQGKVKLKRIQLFPSVINSLPQGEKTMPRLLACIPTSMTLK